MDKPVLATNVVLKVKLHKALEFRHEDPLNLSSNNTILSKELGNVNEDTDVTFEYKIKETEELIKLEGFDLSVVKELPF